MSNNITTVISNPTSRFVATVFEPNFNNDKKSDIILYA